MLSDYNIIYELNFLYIVRKWNINLVNLCKYFMFYVGIGNVSDLMIFLG